MDATSAAGAIKTSCFSRGDELMQSGVGVVPWYRLGCPPSVRQFGLGQAQTSNGGDTDVVELRQRLAADEYNGYAEVPEPLEHGHGRLPVAGILVEQRSVEVGKDHPADVDVGDDSQLLLAQITVDDAALDLRKQSVARIAPKRCIDYRAALLSSAGRGVLIGLHVAEGAPATELHKARVGRFIVFEAATARMIEEATRVGLLALKAQIEQALAGIAAG